MDSKSTGYSNTGYYCNKWWNGGYGSGAASRTHHTDPLVRMAELYLNYAEAVNETAGPRGTAGGCSLTALGGQYDPPPGRDAGRAGSLHGGCRGVPGSGSAMNVA